MADRSSESDGNRSANEEEEEDAEERERSQSPRVSSTVAIELAEDSDSSSPDRLKMDLDDDDDDAPPPPPLAHEDTAGSSPNNDSPFDEVEMKVFPSLAAHPPPLAASHMDAAAVAAAPLVYRVDNAAVVKQFRIAPAAPPARVPMQGGRRGRAGRNMATVSQRLSSLRKLLPKAPAPPLADMTKVRAPTVSVPTCDEPLINASTQRGRKRGRPRSVGQVSMHSARLRPAGEVSLVTSGLAARPLMAASVVQSSRPPRQIRARLSNVSPDLQSLSYNNSSMVAGINAYAAEDGGGELHPEALAAITALNEGDGSPPVESAPWPDHVLDSLDPTAYSRQGYRCAGCEELFRLKSSLEFHSERKVEQIEAFCNECDGEMAFNNRCNYRSHARQFHQRPPADVYSKIKLSALSEGALTKSFAEWFASAAFRRLSDIDELFEFEFGAKIGASFKALHGGDGQQQASVNHTLHGSPPPRTFECSECEAAFPDALALRNHFAYNLPPNQRQLICSTPNCSAVYFSQCSFSSHRRLHMAASESGEDPYTCPECGLLQPDFASLHTHLAEHLTEPTVLNAWRCTSCAMFYSNWETLVVHTAAAHCAHFYPCPGCDKAFKDTAGCEAHIRKDHSHMDVRAVDIGSSIAQKCLQCSLLFRARDQLCNHLKAHLNTLRPFKIYRCPMCGRLLENKAGLLSHYSRIHSVDASALRVVEWAPSATAAATEQRRRKRSLSHAHSATQQPVASHRLPTKCDRCEKQVGNEFLLKLHLRVEHGVKLQPSEMKSSQLDDAQPLTPPVVTSGRKRKPIVPFSPA